jgi:tubulin monoglycylase TTLL15
LDLRTKRGQILFFVITFSSAILAQFLSFDSLKEIYWHRHDKCSNFTCPEVATSGVLEKQEFLEPKRPQYMIIGDDPNGAHLRHVKKVLDRLGLKRVFENETKSEDVDLFWSHSYPFIKDRPRMSNLRGHQKVNHYPGIGYITNKVDLAATNLKYIPKSFRLPNQEKELREYAEKNPEKLFVQKNNQHRHIKIRKISEIDFTRNDTFIQEYIDNPLLVDGLKFDIGVYTIITSVDPLRLYIYHGDVLLRYCSVKYHPFDPENVDKYIVGDDYVPSWEVPSLSKFYNGMGMGMRQSFDAYIESKGYDSKILWSRVEDAIRQTILSKESEMAKLLGNYRYKQAFFEMIRFDLIADDALNVYVMEANMSPNLSSAHFQQNTLLYEQVIFNLLNLVGVGSYLNRESFVRRYLKRFA